MCPAAQRRLCTGTTFKRCHIHNCKCVHVCFACWRHRTSLTTSDIVVPPAPQPIVPTSFVLARYTENTFASMRALRTITAYTGVFGCQFFVVFYVCTWSIWSHYCTTQWMTAWTNAITHVDAHVLPTTTMCPHAPWQAHAPAYKPVHPPQLQVCRTNKNIIVVVSHIIVVVSLSHITPMWCTKQSANNKNTSNIKLNLAMIIISFGYRATQVSCNIEPSHVAQPPPEITACALPIPSSPVAG